MLGQEPGRVVAVAGGDLVVVAGIVAAGLCLCYSGVAVVVSALSASQEAVGAAWEQLTQVKRLE